MKLFVLAVVLGVCAAVEDAVGGGVCFLLDGKEPSKPFPSLTQCYKNNQEACCVSAHDSTIEGSYSGLMSATCLREYQQLEHYFCLGCNPNMFDYVHWYNASPKCYDADESGRCTFSPFVCTEELCGTDHASHGWGKDGKLGMVKICNGFMNQLMYSSSSCTMNDADCKIDKYDNCGLNLAVEGFGGGDAVGWYPSAYFVNTETGNQDPMKFLTDIRPPYFDGLFHISIEGYAETNSRKQAKADGRVTVSTCTCEGAYPAECDCEPVAGYPYFDEWTNPPNAPEGYNSDSCFSAASSIHMSVLAVLAGFAALFAGQFM